MTSKLQEQVAYNFERDLIEVSNVYPSSDVRYVVVNDNNKQSYSQNWVNFNNLSLVGSAPDSFLAFSEGRVDIPIEVTATLANATFPSGSSVEQFGRAILPKAYHHFVDVANITFSGIGISQNENINLMINENLKNLTTDEILLYGDLMNCYKHSSETYGYSATYGEYNNADENNFLVKSREKHGEVLIDGAASLYDTILGGANGVIQNEKCGLVSKTTTVLKYQWMISIPLAKLHPFFERLPSVSNASKFTLRLQLNCGSYNSWNVTYNSVADVTAITIKELTPFSVASNQSVGNTCPFLVSKFYTTDTNAKDTYPVILHGANNVKPVLTITSVIGWEGATYANSVPCRLVIPEYKFTAEFAKSILNAPRFTMRYENYNLDMDEGKAGGSSVRRSLQNQVARPRMLYILPFLSAISTSAPKARQSLLSSSPSTCSMFRVSNLQVSIGGTYIYPQSLNTTQEFYNHLYLPVQAKLNGNSIRSEVHSGLITKTDFERCYGVIAIDLQKVSDEQTDSLAKQIEVIFTIAGKSSVKWDIVYLTTYQVQTSVDRITGEIVM